jgi:hypothetical protein
MPVGIHLLGAQQDIATLWALAEVAPELVSAPWVEHALAQGSVITTDALSDPERQARLRARGLALRDCPQGGRPAPHLAGAVRPLSQSGDPPCALAWLVADAERPEARDTLERLLLLGRDDVRTGLFEADGRRALVVEVAHPPLYLLMRARQEPQEGVRAYAQQGPSVLVEWGWRHPLQPVADQLAQRLERTVLVDSDGRWRYAPRELALGSIYDGLSPELGAPELDLAPSPGEHRFTLRLRLGPGPDTEPELWLLDPAAFARLEELIESTSAEQLAALTVCRLEEAGRGVCYLLRERARPGLPRLGPRVGDIVGQRGFARATGLEQLYLPARRRLVPAMRRDDLRAMLSLGEGAPTKLVIVEEDSEGLRVLRVRELHEQPLTAWLELVALDRRVELDRMLDDALFRFPGVQIEPRPQPRARLEVPRPERPARPVQRRRETRPEARVEPAPEPLPPAPEPEDAVAALTKLRQRARELEEQVAQGGVVEPQLWSELASLKAQLDEAHDACACLEAAAFHQPAGPGSGLPVLVDLRFRLSEPAFRSLELAELALREPLSAGAATLLGARLLERLARGEPLEDGLMQHVVELFSEPRLPVSRRLAWTVLRECHRVSRDRLGLTRAREAVLGGLNTQGLTDVHDVPRFVRQVLALGEHGERAAGEAGDRLRVLEELWAVLEEHDEPFDVLHAYQRVIFAVGFVRMGLPSRARELVARVENELPAHDLANRGLFRLYLARLAVGSGTDEEAWAAEYRRVEQSFAGDAAWRAVDWYCRRSDWLRPAPVAEPVPWVRGPIERQIASVEASPEQAPAVLQEILREREYYDYEVEQAVQRSVRASMATGNDALMGELVRAISARLDSIGSLTYRVRAVGACLRAAAAASDTHTVQGLLDKIVDIAHAADTPSVRGLLAAVRPALAALRPLGAGQAASEFLLALVPRNLSAEQVPLLASLAEGFCQQRDRVQADQLMEQAVSATLLERVIDYAHRDEGAAAVLQALRHWPVLERAMPCQHLLRNLPLFRDAFSVRRYFPTYQLLLLERLVDTLVDEEVVSSDRLRTYLDEEELAIRRQIHADWNSL